MNEGLKTLIIQMACYAVAMLIAVLPIAFFQRGFFWQYFRVRASLGRLVLVKIRTPLRDHFATGWVEENFLCYKLKPWTIRISINTMDKIFYRSMGINWVDVDEEKHAICKADYSSVSGFDAKKHSDLLTRALMRPAISSGQEKIMLVCIIVVALLCLIIAYLSYKNMVSLNFLVKNIGSIVSNAVGDRGTVVSGTL